MSTVPTKRRKMRPNNAIAVAKLDKARLSNAEATSTEPISKTSEKEKDNQKKFNADENQTNQTEKKRQSGIKRVRKKSIDKSLPEPKKNKTTNSTVKKLSTPKPLTYSSASDSDETDDEARSRYNKKASTTPAKVTAPVMSASDSDETDTEKQKKNSLKQKQQQRKTTPKSKPPVLSASDSDETDTEQTKMRKPSKPVKKATPVSDSDSDETDQEQRSSKPKKSTQPMSASDSDDTGIEKDKKDTPQSDSDSDSSSNGRQNTNKKIEKAKSKPKDRSHLSANRISFRRTQEYDESKSAAENLKNRLSDLFVPEVNEDFFISDSDSETDSGEDYENKEYPSWQRTLSASHNQEKDPWPKQRKLGYSDKLRLEKRVKKICRREGITFDQVRHIFSSSHRAEYVKFFQRIGKIFPDMSLHRLAKLCKEMYHEKRNMGPWTKEEIKKLEELLKIHGNNPTIISEYINRSPKNISDYIYNHGKAPKKVNVKWTKEEDEILAKEAAKILKKDGKISFHTIEPLFKGTRTQKQIHTRYQTIRNLIQPDGTLAKKRKATEYEELRYLKRLLNQVREHRLVEESQLDFAKDRGFVHPKFYLKNRAMIKGFENMSIKTILQTLIDKQKRIIESRKEEKLLESEPESD